MVYYCFNNPFPDDFGIPVLNIPPITFDDRPRMYKRALYTPDLIPANISDASENYFSTLTTPSDYPDILPSDDPNTVHVMNMDAPVRVRAHRGYCCRKHDKKDATKRQYSIAPHSLIRKQSFSIVYKFIL